MISVVIIMLETNLDFVLISLDIANAFNEVMRQKVLEMIWFDESLRDIWYYFWRMKSINSYVGLGSGNQMKTARYTCNEGKQ